MSKFWHCVGASSGNFVWVIAAPCWQCCFSFGSWIWTSTLGCDSGAFHTGRAARFGPSCFFWWCECGPVPAVWTFKVKAASFFGVQFWQLDPGQCTWAHSGVSIKPEFFMSPRNRIWAELNLLACPEFWLAGMRHLSNGLDYIQQSMT